MKCCKIESNQGTFPLGGETNRSKEGNSSTPGTGKQLYQEKKKRHRVARPPSSAGRKKCCAVLRLDIALRKGYCEKKGERIPAVRDPSPVSWL